MMKAKGTHSELCREKLMEFYSANVEYYSLGIGHIDHRAQRLTHRMNVGWYNIFQTEKPTLKQHTSTKSQWRLF